MTGQPPDETQVRASSFLEFCGDVGLELEPGQREIARVLFDGEAPDPAAGLFEFEGPPPEEARDVAEVMGAVRIGKSLIYGAARAVHLACSVDIRGLRRRETIVCSFIAPKQQKAIDTMAYALGIFEEHMPDRVVGRVRQDKTPDEFYVRSPFCWDGPFIRFAAFGADAGGLDARGLWHLYALLEEFWLFKGAGYKLNDRVIYDSVRSRVWRRGGGGQMGIIGSPWAKVGKGWEVYRDNRKAPTTAVVVKAPVERVRSDPSVLAGARRVRAEYEARGEPEIAARELDAEPMDLGSVRVYDDDTIARCGRTADPFERRGGDMFVAGGDLGFLSDHAALVVYRLRWVRVAWLEGDEAREADLLVRSCVFVGEWVPRPGEPLAPSKVCGEMAAHMLAFGVLWVCADGHYIASLFEACAGKGVAVVRAPASPVEVHANARGLMRDVVGGRPKVDLLPDPRLLHQLPLVQKRPVGGGGWSIDIPRGQASPDGGGGHGDVAVANANALWQAGGVEVPMPVPEKGTKAWYAAQEAALDAAEEAENDGGDD